MPLQKSSSVGLTLLALCLSLLGFPAQANVFQERGIGSRSLLSESWSDEGGLAHHLEDLRNYSLACQRHLGFRFAPRQSTRFIADGPFYIENFYALNRQELAQGNLAVDVENGGRYYRRTDSKGNLLHADHDTLTRRIAYRHFVASNQIALEGVEGFTAEIFYPVVSFDGNLKHESEAKKSGSETWEMKVDELHGWFNGEYESRLNWDTGKLDDIARTLKLQSSYIELKIKGKKVGLLRITEANFGCVEKVEYETDGEFSSARKVLGKHCGHFGPTIFHNWEDSTFFMEEAWKAPRYQGPANIIVDQQGLNNWLQPTNFLNAELFQRAAYQKAIDSLEAGVALADNIQKLPWEILLEEQMSDHFQQDLSPRQGVFYHRQRVPDSEKQYYEFSAGRYFELGSYRIDKKVWAELSGDQDVSLLPNILLQLSFLTMLDPLLSPYYNLAGQIVYSGAGTRADVRRQGRNGFAPYYEGFQFHGQEATINRARIMDLENIFALRNSTNNLRLDRNGQPVSSPQISINRQFLDRYIGLFSVSYLMDFIEAQERP